MTIHKQLENELKVGIFVSVGIGLIMLAILLLGGANNVIARQNSYLVNFPSVEGLISGAKVVLGGLQIGTVAKVDFDREKRDIRVVLKVARKYEEFVRKDSTAEILTQGVLGDKYVSISSGSPEEPILETESHIPYRPTKDLAQFLSKSDQLMVSLNSIANNLDKILKTFDAQNRSETFFQGLASTTKNLGLITQKLSSDLEKAQLKPAINNLNAILDKINNGTGTLGALINDPGLYYDTRALMGGANRNRIIRNLVRQTIKESEKADH